MVFVDGTNVLNWLGRVQLQGEDGNTRSLGWRLNQHCPPAEACRFVGKLIKQAPPTSLGHGYTVDIWVRWYWFGSYEGGDRNRKAYYDAVKAAGFQPWLAKKRENGEKGVDMALALEMLTNAINQNFDVGVLLAGDSDYVPLVREVRRHGQRVIGLYGEGAVRPDLAGELDGVIDLLKYVNGSLPEARHEMIQACLQRTSGKRPKGELAREVHEALERLRIVRMDSEAELQERRSALTQVESALAALWGQEDQCRVSLKVTAPQPPQSE